MKKFNALLILIFIMITHSNAQDQKSDLPYYQIPDYPETYSANNVAARMVDGLGFRYFWATEGLREEDLAYKPSADSRTIGETLQHIYGLSRTIMTAPQSEVNTYPKEDLTFEETRKKTLENIQRTSRLLKEGKQGDMDNYKMIFQRGDDITEYPFWNMINGPIADAIYHTGQVVGYRRASGNPIPSGVRMLTGKKTE